MSNLNANIQMKALLLTNTHALLVKINELIQIPDHGVCVCLWHWVRQEHIL